MNKLRIFAVKYFKTALGSLYLLSLGLLMGKGRAKLALMAEQFGWKNPEKSYPTILPKLDIRELFEKGVDISIHDFMGQDGNVSLLELVVINSLVKRFSPRAIFEIGTFDGRTALNMAANSVAEAKVYTLDLPDKEVEEAKKNPLGDIKFVGKVSIGYKYKGTPHEEKITELKGDSAEFDYSLYHKKIDMVFIDGAHSYDYVSSDTENALKIVRGESIILWPDYRPTCEGVTRFLNEYYSKGGMFNNLRWIDRTNLAILLPSGVMKTLK